MFFGNIHMENLRIKYTFLIVWMVWWSIKWIGHQQRDSIKNRYIWRPWLSQPAYFLFEINNFRSVKLAKIRRYDSLRLIQQLWYWYRWWLNVRTWIERHGTVVGSVSQNIRRRTEGRLGWGRNRRAGALSFVTSVRFMSLLLSSPN